VPATAIPAQLHVSTPRPVATGGVLGFFTSWAAEGALWCVLGFVIPFTGYLWGARSGYEYAGKLFSVTWAIGESHMEQVVACRCSPAMKYILAGLDTHPCPSSAQQQLVLATADALCTGSSHHR
jgi:hypothetical protein